MDTLLEQTQLVLEAPLDGAESELDEVLEDLLEVPAAPVPRPRGLAVGTSTVMSTLTVPCSRVCLNR